MTFRAAAVFPPMVLPVPEMMASPTSVFPDPAVPSTPEETATNEPAAEPNVWTQPVEYTETLKGGDQLQKLISKTVDPLSWESRGGYGQISIINDLIVVRQSWSNLREIELLLDSIQNAGQ